MSIAIIENGKVVSPLRAFDVLTSEEGARCFRDIGKYTTFEKTDNLIHVTYPSGIPCTAPVKITMRPEGRRIKFSGTGPMNAKIQGLWEIAPDGEVVLMQTVEGIPMRGWAKPLIRRRVRRAIEDLEKCA